MTSRREFIKSLAVAGGVLLLPRTSLFANLPASDAWSQLPEILKRIKPPAFPRRDYNLLSFGGTGDGKTDNTGAFRHAVAACNAGGGGRIVVPSGVFLTGPIHLLSNVNLYLQKDATIKFDRDSSKYLPLVFTRWEGMELMNYSPFIYAFEQRNIAITGQGTLDGQAGPDAWWPWNGRTQYGWKEGDPNQRKSRGVLVDMIEQNVPVNQRMFGTGHYLRPQFI